MLVVVHGLNGLGRKHDYLSDVSELFTFISNEFLKFTKCGVFVQVRLLHENPFGSLDDLAVLECLSS